MWTFIYQSKQGLLPTCKGETGKYRDDAYYGSTLDQTSNRRGGIHGIPVDGHGLFGRPKAHPTLIPNHGQAYDIQAQEPYQIRSERLHQALFTQRGEGYPCQPGMVHGYHLYTDDKRFYVHDSDYWCLQPKDCWLGHQQLDECTVVQECTGGCDCHLW